MVKQVIDGKAYNTETARCLATVDLMGYRMDGRGRFTTKTPKKVGQVRGAGVIPVTRKQAGMGGRQGARCRQDRGDVWQGR
jgi:hypothetical protein